MTYIVVAMVLTNVLTVLNLLLLFGVIRRLRAQTPPPSPIAASGFPSLPIGARVDEFVTTDVDGRPLRREELPVGALIGFFSPGCMPCEELVPKFVAHAAQLPGGRDGVVAVVGGTREDSADYVAKLSRVARVVVEDPTGGLLVKAFQVSAFPNVFQLDGDGRVLVNDVSVKRLAVPAA